MILVTGGTGLVGSHLLYKLTSQGKNVRAIYRNEVTKESVSEVFALFTTDVSILLNKIEWVKADLNDLPALSNAFANVTLVYHCAAYISFDPKDYLLLRKVNIEGTANIVNLCIKNNVKKLCYVSSIAALGKELHHKKITEETYWNPETANNSVYGITKYGAEMEVWRGTQEGVPAVIVNPGIILGSGYWNQGSGTLFKMVKKGVAYKTTGKTGFVDVLDVVDVMVTLMESIIINERYILVAENVAFNDVFA